MRRRSIKPLALLCLAFFCFQAALAQDGGISKIPAGELDPARAVAQPQLFSSFHKPLPEQYIWTREDSAVGQSTFIRYERPGLSRCGTSIWKTCMPSGLRLFPATCPARVPFTYAVTERGPAM